MSSDRPRIGTWFRTPEGDLFEVVARDPKDTVTEVQFYDGTVEEYDLDSWELLEARETPPPEDLSGSLDLSADEYGLEGDGPAGDLHLNPLDELDLKNQ